MVRQEVKPDLQELANTVEAATKVIRETWQRIETEGQFEQRMNAVRHERYLLEVKYEMKAKQEAFDQAIEQMREHYPEIVSILENERWR